VGTRTVTRVASGGLALLLPLILLCLAAAGALAQPAAKAAPSATTYSRTIREGRKAALQLLDATGAASLTLALMSRDQVVWQQTFGYADKATQTAPTADTMYGIGSVSKMLATVAVMRLVDEGKVALDEPLVRYVPAFRMASPDYRHITVRMLLDHSSGLPGTTYGNVTTGVYYPGYLPEVMDTLATSTLKTTPGLISVYCNDGFTLTEALVAAVTGRTFAEYVHDAVLAPLGMDHSAYPLHTFADGTCAKVYDGDTARRFEVLNALASGGLYSTASDMSRLAAMLAGGGTYKGARILSAAAVAEMGRSSTSRSFDPVPSTSYSYGLGWDTVTQPGLAAVGVRGWQKGGDSGDYHAALIVAPKARLAMTVIGTAPLSSGLTEDLAEDVMVHALRDQGTIARLPRPLATAAPPARTATAAQLAAMQGVWAFNQGMFRVTPTEGSAQDLTLSALTPDGWAVSTRTLNLRSDGLFHSAGLTTALGAKAGGGRWYLIYDTLAANGFYRTRQALCQKLQPEEPLSAAWQDHVGQTYLAVNAQPDAGEYNAAGAMTLALGDVPALSGYLTVTTTDYGTEVVDAAGGDDRAAMCLQIPSLGGRDLEDLVVETRGSEDWMHWGDTVYRPLATVPDLSTGQSTLTIGEEGYAEWRAVRSAATVTLAALPHGPLGGIAVAGMTDWILFGADTGPLARGSSFPATVTVPAGGGYLLLFGSAGASATVTSAPAGS
jgi:CubicO group peptidase (beta-lactamase class C family)